MRLYTIYDRKAVECGPLYEAKNDAVAMRQYNQIMEKSVVDRNEFELYYLGEINQETMDITLEKYKVTEFLEVKDGE